MTVGVGSTTYREPPTHPLVPSPLLPGDPKSAGALSPERPMHHLAHTPLFDLHVEKGGQMVDFADWAMPVRFELGVLGEHLHCRDKAGLFDVSHMGQVRLVGSDGTPETAAAALERLTPANIVDLREGRQRYALLTDESGGTLDDIMVARHTDYLVAVINAARRDADFNHLRKSLAGLAEVELLDSRALLALQGPSAEEVLAETLPEVREMRFMDVIVCDGAFGRLWVSRSGYTGEDGFEISVALEEAEALARTLLAHPEVAPIGLGARDSLRLEAGMPLYGADLDTGTSPVEAGLGWSVGKPRRPDGARAGGFPGAERILRELADGPARHRVGLRPEGRAPMRPGTPIFAGPDSADAVGTVTSGGYSPSLAAPVSMAYLAREHAAEGATVYGEVRGRRLPATVVALPFRSPDFRR